MNLKNNAVKPPVWLVIPVSALCFYLGNGLTGNYWFLIWLVPAPLIILSAMSSGKITFIVAFVALQKLRSSSLNKSYR